MATRKSGSTRVKSWVYAVINPWSELLDFERGFLEAEHVSFRHRARTLEHLKPIREQLVPGTRLIIDDLEGERADVKAWEREHDDAVSALQSVAAESYDRLLADPTFAPLVRKRFEEKPALARDFAEDPEFLVRLTAERVVNRADELGSSFGGVDYEFWNAIRNEVLQLRSLPFFQQLTQSRERLLKVIAEQVGRLADLRRELVRTYDIPAAPFE